MIRTFSVKEVLRFAYEKVRDNFSFFFSLVAVMFLVSVPQYIYSYATDAEGLNMQFSLWVSLSALFIFGFIRIVTEIGQIRIMFAQLNSKFLPVSTLFEINNRYIKEFVIGYVLYFLIILSGFILLIIPAIIWSYKYSQWKYLVVDENLSAWGALKKSATITNGNKGKLFSFGFVYGLMTLIGAIPLGLGLIITTPMGWIAGVYIYRFLNTSHKGEITEDMPTLDGEVLTR